MNQRFQEFKKLHGDDIDNAYRSAFRKLRSEKADDEEMNLLDRAYKQQVESLLESYQIRLQKIKQKMQPFIDKKLQDKIELIKHIPDLKIEIIGDWIWVTTQNPNFEPYDLENEDFCYSSNKGGWFFYFREQKADKHLSLEDLRRLYGVRYFLITNQAKNGFIGKILHFSHTLLLSLYFSEHQQ